jgi:hypothetical protein
MKYNLRVFSVYFATHRAWQQAVVSSVCVHACARARACLYMCVKERVHVCEIESHLSVYKVYAKD